MPEPKLTVSKSESKATTPTRSTSSKSVYVTKSPVRERPHPRLSRTLKRHPTIRAFGLPDMRYIWLLYRTNKLQHLDGLKPIFAANPAPAEFMQTVATLLPEIYDYAWVLESGRAVGICFGLDCYRFIVIGDLIWLPWASARQRMETMTKLVMETGKLKTTHFYCSEKDKDIGVHMCRQGIARRIGISVGLGNDRLFETRKA